MIRALSKEKMSIIMIVLIMSTVAFYYHIDNVRNNYRDIKWSEERCEADLETTRYQLTAVTDYKNKIEKLLTETKKSYDADKERFRDVMDSCVAMKQQVIICQNQFEDLIAECKAAKQKLDSIKALKYPEKKNGG